MLNKKLEFSSDKTELILVTKKATVILELRRYGTDRTAFKNAVVVISYLCRTMSNETLLGSRPMQGH